MSKAKWMIVACALATQSVLAGTVGDLAAAQQELMRAELDAKIKEAKRKGDAPSVPGVPMSLPPVPTAGGSSSGHSLGGMTADDPQLVEIYGVDSALIAGILVNGVVRHVTMDAPDLPGGWKVVEVAQNRVVLVKGKSRKEINLTAANNGGGSNGALPPIPGNNALNGFNQR